MKTIKFERLDFKQGCLDGWNEGAIQTASYFREFFEGRPIPEPTLYSGISSNAFFDTLTSTFPSLLNAARLHFDLATD